MTPEQALAPVHPMMVVCLFVAALLAGFLAGWLVRDHLAVERPSRRERAAAFERQLSVSPGASPGASARLDAAPRPWPPASVQARRPLTSRSEERAS
jgi:hypothetical protein